MFLFCDYDFIKSCLMPDFDIQNFLIFVDKIFYLVGRNVLVIRLHYEYTICILSVYRHTQLSIQHLELVLSSCLKYIYYAATAIATSNLNFPSSIGDERQITPYTELFDPILLRYPSFVAGNKYYVFEFLTYVSLF